MPCFVRDIRLSLSNGRLGSIGSRWASCGSSRNHTTTHWPTMAKLGKTMDRVNERMRLFWSRKWLKRGAEARGARLVSCTGPTHPRTAHKFSNFPFHFPRFLACARKLPAIRTSRNLQRCIICISCLPRISRSTTRAF